MKECLLLFCTKNGELTVEQGLEVTKASHGMLLLLTNIKKK